MLIELPDTFVMIVSRSHRATSVLDGDCREHLHDACNVDASALVSCPRRHGVRGEGNAARTTALHDGFSLGSSPYPTDSVGQKSNRHSETAGHVMASVRLGHLVLALHRGFLRAAGSLLSSWLFTSEHTALEMLVPCHVYCHTRKPRRLYASKPRLPGAKTLGLCLLADWTSSASAYRVFSSMDATYTLRRVRGRQEGRLLPSGVGKHAIRVLQLPVAITRADVQGICGRKKGRRLR